MYRYISKVFFVNKGIAAGGKIPQEVLVAIWGAKRSVKETPTVSQKPNTGASVLVMIGQGLKTPDRERDGANTGASLVKTGRKEDIIKKVESEGKQRSSCVPYLGNIRNLNSSAGCVLCAISQATEDRPGECSMPKGASIHSWGINSRSIAVSGMRMKG